MARNEEEGIYAAKILLSLRHRKLLRWPEWVPRSSEEAVVVVKRRRVPVEVWLERRRRSLRRVVVRGTAWWEVAPPGSGPSTSGVDRAPSPTEKVEVAERPSPKTPLQHAAASSSGCDGTPSSPAKRKDPGASGSPGGEEGSTLPAKRPRADLAVPAATVEEPKPEEEKKTEEDEKKKKTEEDEKKKKTEEEEEKKKTEEEEDCRDEKGHLLFDLNEDMPIWQD